MRCINRHYLSINLSITQSRVSKHQMYQPFCILTEPQEVLLSAHPTHPLSHADQVHWLACQQTILQKWHTEHGQINSFTSDALTVADLPINPGFGPAPQYTTYVRKWLGFTMHKAQIKCVRENGEHTMSFSIFLKMVSNIKLSYPEIN